MTDPFLGEIRLFPYTFAPRFWLGAVQRPGPQHRPEHRPVRPDRHDHGGAARTTFALPDLRGRAVGVVGPGPRAQRVRRRAGRWRGVGELTEPEMPTHRHRVAVTRHRARPRTRTTDISVAYPTPPPTPAATGKTLNPGAISRPGVASRTRTGHPTSPSTTASRSRASSLRATEQRLGTNADQDGLAYPATPVSSRTQASSPTVQASWPGSMSTTSPGPM